jgi:hypothetical protein
MKTRKLVPLTFVGAVLAFSLPARGDTMSVPSAANTAYTLEVPSNWKPIGDPSDESVEATSPDDHAYVMAWIVKDSDDSEQKALRKDLDATLKDSMKSIDGKPAMHELDQNGTHFYVFNGTGVDKREGTKVKFLVGVFSAGGDYAGVVYADASADAPESTMNVLEGILKSIKVTKK